MKVISAIPSNINKILGTQTYRINTIYRPILYHKALKIEDGYLVFNVLTRELILLTKNEYLNFYNGNLNDYLINHWFLIPKDLDEYSLFYLFDAAYRNVFYRKQFGRLKLCTILTTTECNARCSYCYENGIRKKTMNNKIALDVAKYIADHSDNPVILKWFGGEPLCNGNVITTICNYLSQNNINYFSTMMSNGYLFDSYNMNTIINIWKLKNVQITLDGTKDIYNKAKSFVNNSGSAFEKVNQNIKELLDNHINITIRLNISSKNVDSMYDLVDYLKEHYFKYNNIRVYSSPLYIGEWNEETLESKSVLYKKYIQLEEYIRKNGLGSIYKIKPFQRCHCMADDGRSTVILPDGNLTVCEHHSDDEYYSNIYSSKCDKVVLDSWYERKTEIQECRTCFYRPYCYEIEKCPISPICDKDIRLYNSWYIETMMKDVYKIYRQSHSKK